MKASVGPNCRIEQNDHWDGPHSTEDRAGVFTPLSVVARRSRVKVLSQDIVESAWL